MEGARRRGEIKACVGERGEREKVKDNQEALQR